jgi:hypothetical protein
VLLRALKNFRTWLFCIVVLWGLCLPSLLLAAITVEATNTSTHTSVTTTQVVALPSGLTSGDLLIIIVTVERDSTNASPVQITTPTDWTLITSCEAVGPTALGDDDVVMRAFKKISDGTEGASVNVTSSSRRGSHNSYRITGHFDLTSVECATTNGSGTTDVDPPNLTPSWGSADNLWIAVASKERGLTAAPAAPTNFGTVLNASAGSTAEGNNTTASARRTTTASSQDPSAFVFANYGAIDWISATIAIRPAAASTGRPIPPIFLD